METDTFPSPTAAEKMEIDMSEEKSDSSDLTGENLQSYSEMKAEQEKSAEKYAEFLSDRGPNYQERVETPSHRYTTTWRQHQRELSDRHFREHQHLHRLEGRYQDNTQSGLYGESETLTLWEQVKRFFSRW
jgi:hypothetical protein